MPTEGQTQINKRTGEQRVFQNGQWVLKPPPKGANGDASLRGRLTLGLGPMVQAQENLRAQETGPSGQRINPLNRDWGAALVDMVPLPGMDALAQRIGGQDYQDYIQAAKAYEAQLMPIMSGAAVSPSEAQRQIRASLPALGNSGQTLAAKDHDRDMQLNGAAKVLGAPFPYPSAQTYGVNSQTVPSARVGPPPAAAGPRTLTPEQARSAPSGTVYRTTDGRILRKP